MLWNHLGKIKGDKVPIFNESWNLLVGNPYLDNSARAPNPTGPLGGNVNDSFESFITASFNNAAGTSASSGNNGLSSVPLPQMVASSYNFSMNEMWGLQKKQHEQSILIENLTSMISRLVHENETKNNRIQKLESQILMLSKVLEDYKQVLALKVQEINGLNNSNSRQRFAEMYSGHNANSNVSNFNFVEHRNAMFQQTQNVNTNQPTVNFCVSQLKDEGKEESKHNEFIEISEVDQVPVESNSNDSPKIKEEKKKGISIYNPSQRSTQAAYHCSMPPIKSMTFSEAEAAREWEQVINNTVNQFSHDAEDNINLEANSFKSLFKDKSSTEWISKPVAIDSSDDEDLKGKSQGVVIESKPQRMWPRKKECASNSSPAKSNHKNDRSLNKKSKKNKPTPKNSESKIGKNKRKREERFMESGTNSSKMGSASYFDSMEYSGRK